MKNFCIPLLVFFTCLNVSAQWVYQNPKPTGDNISAMFFLDRNRGFIGERSIIKTTTGGTDWNAQPINGKVKSIFFIDSQIGWLACTSGRVYQTTDAGESWNIIYHNPLISFNSIFFLNPTKGFAAAKEGNFLETTDGGTNWSKIVLTGVGSEDFMNICFVNSDTGWVSHEAAKIIKTTNGGESWVSYNASGSAPKKIFFLNGNIGFIAGLWGRMYKTVDGGLTWFDIGASIPDYFHLQDVYFIDEMNGWVTTGSYGVSSAVLFRTTNGGGSWHIQNIGMNMGYLNTIYFVDDSTGYTAGDLGYIFKTTDMGNSWMLLTQGERGNIEASAIIDKDYLWAVGMEGFIFKTTNSGDSWTKKPSGVNSDLFSVFFVSDTIGFAAGDGPILKTTNGGESWFQLSVGWNFRNLFFLDENTGWAAGWSGRIAKTTNGGLTWSMNTVTQGDLWSVYFISETEGYLTGQSGYILKTTDGGDNWNPYEFEPGGGKVYAITFTSPDIGYAAGLTVYPMGFIIKTTNRGETWEKITDSNFVFIKKIQFADSANGFAIGNGFYYTTDSGENWYPGGSGTTFSFASKNVIWTMGWGGVIRKRYTDMFTGTENNPIISPGFQLYQNYPNPFNPTTRIKYFIPEAGDVKLIIYDILGREISVLVNEFKLPGEYITEFNGSSMASGIYIYTLQSGNHYQIKKLVLLK